VRVFLCVLLITRAAAAASAARAHTHTNTQKQRTRQHPCTHTHTYTHTHTSTHTVYESLPASRSAGCVLRLKNLTHVPAVSGGSLFSIVYTRPSLGLARVCPLRDPPSQKGLSSHIDSEALVRGRRRSASRRTLTHTHTHTHTRKRYGVRDDLYDKNDIVCLRVDIEVFEPLHVDGGERDRALLSLCATHARTRRQDEDPHTLKELGYHRPGNSRPAAGGTGPADL